MKHAFSYMINVITVQTFCSCRQRYKQECVTGGLAVPGRRGQRQRYKHECVTGGLAVPGRKDSVNDINTSV